MTEGIPEYDELKVRIDAGQPGLFTVLAIGPDESTATGTFSIPFSTLELDNFVLRVGQPRTRRRAFHSSQMEHAKDFGKRLFEQLFSGDVGDVYLGARRVTDSRDRGLRVTLYMTDVPELMQLPWEFLYEPDGAFFLSQSIYTPLVRSLDLKTSPAPRPLTLPLRILGMASSPQGYQTLDADQERQKLEEALNALSAKGLVELTWLERATLSELERRMGAPDEIHVLHYIGHGTYDERTGAGVLLLENREGGPHEVTGEDLCAVLRDERSMRLVVLNSCEGARTSHVDPFSGVASSLVRCRMPAVVGMQVEITDDAAIIFSERFYTALAQGYPVDAALAYGRKAIFASGNDTEFGTPVLFLRAGEAQLFDVTGPTLHPPRERTEPPSGDCDFSVKLEQTPPQAARGTQVTWRLTVENSGDGKLQDLSVKGADGQAVSGAAELAQGQRHIFRWKAVADPAVSELLTVTARDPRGSFLSEQVTATVRIKSVRPQKRARTPRHTSKSAVRPDERTTRYISDGVLELWLHSAATQGQLTDAEAVAIAASARSYAPPLSADIPLGAVQEAFAVAVQEGRVTSKYADVILTSLANVGRIGPPPDFPIADYHLLPAKYLQTHLGDLTPAELRRVRDYEEQFKNRKTVLDAIAQKLA
jgi:hypothetical protein